MSLIFSNFLTLFHVYRKGKKRDIKILWSKEIMHQKFLTSDVLERGKYQRRDIIHSPTHH